MKCGYVSLNSVSMLVFRIANATILTQTCEINLSSRMEKVLSNPEVKFFSLLLCSTRSPLYTIFLYQTKEIDGKGCSAMRSLDLILE